MPSYPYRDSHVKDKTVSPTVLSLTWESPYLEKTVFILRRGPGSVSKSGCQDFDWFWMMRKFVSYSIFLNMMTSSDENIFRVNGHLCGEFTGQRRSFDVFFHLRLNIRLSKQSWGWWFETPPRPLWRHCNGSICWSRTSWLFTVNSILSCYAYNSLVKYYRGVTWALWRPRSPAIRFLLNNLFRLASKKHQWCNVQICQGMHEGLWNITADMCDPESFSVSLQWRSHNERDSVCYHRRLDCLLILLLRCRPKK